MKNDKILIGFILFGVSFFTLFYLRSSFWSTLVPVGTALAGILSKENWEDKLTTMADTALGIGLISTLLGLGTIVAPAIATRNIEALGFGISVKIEASVVGLTIAVCLNVIIASYTRRELKDEKKKK
jgi:hypothetical protein